MEENQIKNTANNLAVPISIVIAGVIVALAIIFGGGGSSGQVANNNAGAGAQPPAQPQPTGSTDEYRKITSKDHILGNPNAAVKIIEYSDFECPFCKRFHETMNSVIEKAGPNGDVAWVYRHFPLDQLHPKNARRAAVASECATELGGNDAFWKFANGWFEVSPTNDRTDFEAVVGDLVREMGLNETAFNKCLVSGKYDSHIQEDVDNAVATGGRGTPWSIVVAPNGKTFSLNGAQPLASVEQLIDLAKNEK
jgi:protein-disulfide isomerase